MNTIIDSQFSRTSIKNFLKRVRLALITPHGRSGSIFFHGLFDGHPEVYVLPGYYNYFEYITDGRSLEESVNLFIENNQKLFSLSEGVFSEIFSKNDPSIVREEISKKDFSRYVLEIGKFIDIQNDVIFAKIIHYVFLRFYGKKIDKINILLFHIHNYQNTIIERGLHIGNSLNPQEKLLVQGAKMIALTRHPIESFYSFSKLHNNGPAYFLTRIYSEISNFFYLFKNINSFGLDNVIILDLGALHASPDIELRRVCDFLGTSVDSCMKNSTFNGQAWYGTSTSNSPSNTFNPKILELKYKQVENSKNYFYYFVIISIIFEHVNKYLGYEIKRQSTIDKFQALIFLLISITRLKFSTRATVENIVLDNSQLHKKLTRFFGKRLSTFFVTRLHKIIQSSLAKKIHMLEKLRMMYRFKSKIYALMR